MTEQVIIQTDKKLFECGCNNVVSKVRNKYIQGHHNRGKNNPFYGMRFCGPNSPRWNGGRTKSSDGYWYVIRKEHHRLNTNLRDYVPEHILVFEETYNCCVIMDWGVVHHINRIKDNNRIALHNTKEMDGRQCSICGSYETFMRKCKVGLRPMWHISKDIGLFTCRDCYHDIHHEERLSRNKKYSELHHDKVLAYAKQYREEHREEINRKRRQRYL